MPIHLCIYQYIYVLLAGDLPLFNLEPSNPIQTNPIDLKSANIDTYQTKCRWSMSSNVFRKSNRQPTKQPKVIVRPMFSMDYLLLLYRLLLLLVDFCKLFQKKHKHNSLCTTHNVFAMSSVTTTIIEEISQKT